MGNVGNKGIIRISAYLTKYYVMHHSNRVNQLKLNVCATVKDGNDFCLRESVFTAYDKLLSVRISPFLAEKFAI